MKKAARALMVAGGVLMLAVVAMLVVGAMLPAAHTASVQAQYGVAPPRVWQAITSFEAFPEWRTSVDRVEPRTFPDGATGWIEFGSSGPLPMAVDVAETQRRLVLRIASDDLPFGGTWTYLLEARSGGTLLTITEDGIVHNRLFRFMARFVFGHTATMETYLIDLGGRFGEQTSPVVVAVNEES